MTRTPDDLRRAMNELARTTDPLEPGPILRSGRRRRGRRRLAVVTGAAVALVAVSGGIIALRPGGDAPVVVSGAQAVRDLANARAGLRAGDYVFARTGAYLMTDIVRADIGTAGSYLVEYRNKLALMRVGNTTYLKPPGAGTYSGPGVLEQLKNAGLPQAEIGRYQTAIAQLSGTRWLRVDQQRLAEAARVDEQSSLDYIAPVPTASKLDITGADALIGAVTTAERRGDTITGTLDATRIDDELNLVIGDPAGYYGPSARAMTYEATLDGQGRLTSFTLNLPGTLASQAPDSRPEPPLIITVSQYGGVEAPQPPAGAATVTDLTYELLARDND
ncbi:hypothetical protein Aab01nite_79870 [Paractinoplanes abujensis]|uniref:Uncharacterized protein n=1 Tax=Paractinoplanes abujensis TaxID=882441 RepID=A0A7W7CTW2_9ACTN|nr:hypothetical protein [Actinoplanes abujensis]MBB4693198.1 hypothetical protein [Actinoplanes abujensis]GID24397.1 hypothetical protein Aab01nite_79870 [Actinoplanes abujensis]